MWWVMFVGSVLILLGVVSLALYATFRRPDRRWQPHSRILIVGGGLVFTPAVLLALLLYGIGSGHALLPLPSERDVFRVQVLGHQWWWEVRYPDVEGGPLYSANEIHVPAGQPIDIEVRGADVIHSFWIPRLGGKIDALPGRTNIIRLEAPEPGIYRGQCAEFCGAQHARMALLLQAHEAEELTDRLAPLSEGPEAPSTEDAGHTAFQRHCAQCHSLDGRTPSPQAAPNLADLPYRERLGAGTVPNDLEGLQAWLSDHQSLKPRNRMPDQGHLDAPTLHAIARYLETRR